MPSLARLVEEARLRLELRDSALGAALAATWPERRPEVPVLRPSPGLAAYALRNVPGIPKLVLALFGRSGDELKRTVERVIAQQQGAEPFLPVFLTNDHDFTSFRDQRLAFEYFPFVLDEAATAPDPRWAAYFLDTLELSLRRWGVRQVVGRKRNTRVGSAAAAGRDAACSATARGGRGRAAAAHPAGCRGCPDAGRPGGAAGGAGQVGPGGGRGTPRAGASSPAGTAAGLARRHPGRSASPRRG